MAYDFISMIKCDDKPIPVKPNKFPTKVLAGPNTAYAATATIICIRVLKILLSQLCPDGSVYFNGLFLT